MTDQILFWSVVGFLILFMVVFAFPRGSFRRFERWINTCSTCGQYKSHAEDCTVDDYPEGW